VVLLILGIFLPSSSAASGIWRNETALVELYGDWQANANPAEHQFIHEVHEFYHNDTNNVFSNNLMGVITLTNQDYHNASKYFRTACENSHFLENDYVMNYIRAQNMIDARETVAVLADVLQKDIYNVDIINSLVYWLTIICRQSQQPLLVVLPYAYRLPTIHPLWVLFAESALRVRSTSGFDATHAAAVTTYALTIYPRSCELLLLRAMLYLQEGDTACAGELYHSAAQVKGLYTDQFNASQYFDELAQHTTTTNTTSNNTNNTTNNSAQCMPHLQTHSIAHYQTLIRSIFSTVGDYWTNLTTHHIIPTYRNITPLLTHSVHTAYIEPVSIMCIS